MLHYLKLSSRINTVHLGKAGMRRWNILRDLVLNSKPGIEPGPIYSLVRLRFIYELPVVTGILHVVDVGNVSVYTLGVHEGRYHGILYVYDKPRPRLCFYYAKWTALEIMRVMALKPCNVFPILAPGTVYDSVYYYDRYCDVSCNKYGSNTCARLEKLYDKVRCRKWFK